MNVQYVGIAVVPVAVFAFGAALNGLVQWYQPRRLALLGAPLAALVLLSWTNPAGLVRASATTIEVGGAIRIERTFGPVFFAGWIYSNLLTVTGTVLVLRAVVYAQEVFRRGTIALLVGVFVPWTAQFLYLAGYSSVEPEAFFAVTGAAFAYATLRYRKSDLRPVARDAVLDLLDDGVLVVNARDHVVDANPAAHDMLEDDPVGDPVELALAAQPDLLSSYRSDAERDDVVLESSDETRHVDVRLSTVPASAIAPSGSDPQRVVVLRDVTTLREHERELERQNERLERVRDVLAHDLRNPLNVAAGYLHMARDGDGDALDGIERTHDRIEMLIDDVLTLADAGQELEPERVDLANAASEAWATVDTDGAVLDVEDGITLEADESRLQQLMENLFANSVEHGSTSPPSPGEDADPDVEVRVGAFQEVVRSDGERDVGFYVEDDGPGIPEAERECVLEHGHSGGDGTGFGLAIVEEIAEAHGWGVRVTEGTEGGARFEFVTPD